MVKIWASEESPFGFRQEKEITLLFSKAFRPALGFTLHSVEWVPETFPYTSKGKGTGKVLPITVHEGPEEE
jgi:hypothetical protein